MNKNYKETKEEKKAKKESISASESTRQQTFVHGVRKISNITNPTQKTQVQAYYDALGKPNPTVTKTETPATEVLSIKPRVVEQPQYAQASPSPSEPKPKKQKTPKTPKTPDPGIYTEASPGEHRAGPGVKATKPFYNKGAANEPVYATLEPVKPVKSKKNYKPNPFYNLGAADPGKSEYATVSPDVEVAPKPKKPKKPKTPPPITPTNPAPDY